MLICTVLFLIHHIYVKPFSRNLLNSIETLFLMMLIIIGMLNILPAYNYIYPTYSYIKIQSIIQILNNIETAVNLAFPFIISLLVVIFICIRCFQLLFWLFQSLTKIEPYCCKCKKRSIENYDNNTKYTEGE